MRWNGRGCRAVLSRRLAEWVGGWVGWSLGVGVVVSSTGSAAGSDTSPPWVPLAPC